MKPIIINNSILTEDALETYLTASASGSTLTVKNISGFTTNQIILVGELGSENSEIIKTHATTSPTGTTITLASSLVQTYQSGTKVRVIPYDQVEISHATTITGDKTVLDTVSLTADSIQTRYEDQDYSAGYYFIRFKNTALTPNIYSDYSDPIPYDGYETNTVGNIIAYALKRNKLETFTKFVDYNFCIEEINSCLKYISGKLKKWTRLQEFDYELGTLTRGNYKLAMPTNVWKHSYKSVLDVRVEGKGALTYKDKKEFNDLFEGVLLKTATAATAGDTTFELDDTTNLDDDGTVMVNGNLITYTGISGNTLTGIPASGTGAITETITAGDNVWQGSYKEGTPLYFTVYDEYMYFYPLTSSSTASRRIFADFWKEAPQIDSDNDEIDVYRYDMVKHWLTWAIRMQLKNDGVRNLNDGDYMQFEVILNDSKRGEIHGQKYKTKPSLNTIKF
jgi:hypothetical protein